MNQPREMDMVLVIYNIKESEIMVPFEGIFTIDTLTIVLMNFDSDEIEEYDEIVCALIKMGS